MKTIFAYIFAIAPMMLAITTSNGQSMPAASEQHETVAVNLVPADEKTPQQASSSDAKHISSKKKKNKDAKTKENEQEDDTSSLLLTTP